MAVTTRSSPFAVVGAAAPRRRMRLVIGRRQVGPEARVQAADLACRLRQQRQLRVGRALAPQLVEHVVGRATAGLGGGNGRHGGRVPAFDPGERRLEVQAAERSAQRALPLVFVPRRECDRQECGEQQQVPLPPAEMPVAAGEDRDERLGQEDDGRSHREEDRVAAIEEELDEPDRGERVQRHGDDGQDVKDAGTLAGWGRPVERRELGDREDGPDDHQRDEPPEQHHP